MKSIITSAVLCYGIVAASAAGVADFAATYKGSGEINHLGKVYPSTITLKVRNNGTAIITQTFTWTFGPITEDFTGWVSGTGDIVLQSASGHKTFGGKINGKAVGAKVTGLN